MSLVAEANPQPGEPIPERPDSHRSSTRCVTAQPMRTCDMMQRPGGEIRGALGKAHDHGNGDEDDDD